MTLRGSTMADQFDTYVRNINAYGSEEHVLASNVNGTIACCNVPTKRIYRCWGECVLCPKCGKVIEEGVQDAMGGTHGSAFFYYNNYTDFLKRQPSSEDASGVSYH